MAVNKQSARLNFRLQPGHKHLIERAATSVGKSVSEFAVSALVQSARAALDEARITHVSDRDSEMFLKMLDRPPKPNAALMRAAKRFKQQRG